MYTMKKSCKLSEIYFHEEPYILFIFFAVPGILSHTLDPRELSTLSSY